MQKQQFNIYFKIIFLNFWKFKPNEKLMLLCNYYELKNDSYDRR